MLLLTGVLGVLSSAIALFGMRTSHLQVGVARIWARSILFIGGVRVEIENRERLAAAGPYVIISNHLSFIDTPVILASIPVQFRFLAKEELFEWWPWLVVAWHLKTAGHIAVPVVRPEARGVR